MIRNLIRGASFAGSCLLILLALHGSAAARVGVPELDPGSIAGGLAILGGAAMLLIERFRRR